MKNISKFLLLFIILNFLINVIPTKVLAKTTEYVKIDQFSSIEVGNLSLSSISFDDTGDGYSISYNDYNNSNEDKLFYEIVGTFYDSNYNLLSTLTSGKLYAEKGKMGARWLSSKDSTVNVDEKVDFNKNDVLFYKLSIVTYEDSNSIINNNSTSENNIINSTENEQDNYYEYVINNYSINIVVNENNTFDIIETITANFNVPKHGIFRTIPLKNTITRLDGTTSTNRAQIYNLSVDNKYTTSRENGNYKIKIGSSDKTFTGEHKYVIKYTYNIGKDPIKNKDELYYNLIGTEWDTSIKNVNFSITMPKEFDSSKLGFSSGDIGTTDSSKIAYNVDGNVINGKYNGTLNEGEALTVRLELPDGYFVGAGLDINVMDYIALLIPVIFLAISILLWYKFGRDDQVIETVEFYPPQGFNSLEVGFLYKGKAENKDVTSLLIYLANQGYIKIAETEEKSLFSKSKGFKITKLKEYDGNNINEQLFLNGLFTKKSSFTSLFSKASETSSDNLNEVTSKDLYDNFYITMSRILSNINKKANKNKLFEKSASGKSIFIILMIIATYCLITIPPILAYGEADLIFVAILFPGIGFSALFGMLFGKTPITVKIFGLIWGLGFGVVPCAFIILPCLIQEPIYLFGYIIGILCVLGMIICFKYLPKRTKYGNEMLCKLRGFKNFLETAEKEKLEAMVMQDPTYFYNILPYTYVLGVSDKWIKKFETISLQAPSWYDSPNSFHMESFGTFMNSTMASAQRVMSSSPSSDSSGSGGSSGGGSGGGGGGSW